VVHAGMGGDERLQGQGQLLDQAQPEDLEEHRCEPRRLRLLERGQHGRGGGQRAPHRRGD
jgi:hypothetical protein